MFVAAAREWHVPARLTTGYRLGEAGEAQEMSAWAEAFAPGLGWVAFNSVHNLCPGDRYVRIAVGLDAKDAAPLRFWSNATETAVTASLQVEQAGLQSQN